MQARDCKRADLLGGCTPSRLVTNPTVTSSRVTATGGSCTASWRIQELLQLRASPGAVLDATCAAAARAHEALHLMAHARCRRQGLMLASWQKIDPSCMLQLAGTLQQSCPKAPAQHGEVFCSQARGSAVGSTWLQAMRASTRHCTYLHNALHALLQTASTRSSNRSCS